VGLADDHRASSAQSAHDLAVRRRRTRDGGGPVARRLAGDVDVVLDEDGHAEQRRGRAGVEAALGLRRLGARGLRADAAEGVELRVEPLDALQAGVDELGGGRVASAEGVGLRGEGREGGGAVGGGHGATVRTGARPVIGRLPYAVGAPQALERRRRKEAWSWGRPHGRSPSRVNGGDEGGGSWARPHG
jgi:hypothetical protein